MGGGGVGGGGGGGLESKLSDQLWLSFSLALAKPNNINSILSVWSAYFSLRRGCAMVMKCCMGSLVTLLRPIHLLGCRAVHPLRSNQIKSTETIFKRQLFMRKALIVFSLHMSLSSKQFCRNPFRKIHFLYFHLSKENGSTYNRTRFPFWEFSF